ncbi:MAG: hypothetical protein Q4B82_08410 [Alysiella sp.]|uniref:hypothetical protein n=1 Tax=Alysiella sp. TaxID=1872483 RepID=UPI0026DA9628|nr:hypothetical protein [Alysiella sp.]MDO4434584.1 hypothetical protein [Alysiella sp.]
MMTTDQLIQAGQALYGEQWQSNLARSLNIDSRRIRQWLKGERPLPPWLAHELVRLLQHNIHQCQACLSQIEMQQNED